MTDDPRPWPPEGWDLPALLANMKRLAANAHTDLQAAAVIDATRRITAAINAARELHDAMPPGFEDDLLAELFPDDGEQRD